MRLFWRINNELWLQTGFSTIILTTSFRNEKNNDLSLSSSPNEYNFRSYIPLSLCLNIKKKHTHTHYIRNDNIFDLRFCGVLALLSIWMKYSIYIYWSAAMRACIVCATNCEKVFFSLIFLLFSVCLCLRSTATYALSILEWIYGLWSKMLYFVACHLS